MFYKCCQGLIGVLNCTWATCSLAGIAKERLTPHIQLCDKTHPLFILLVAKTGWRAGKEANTKTNAISVHVYLLLVL